MDNPVVKFFLGLISGISFLKPRLSRLGIRILMRGVKERPYPFSLWSPQPRIEPDPCGDGEIGAEEAAQAPLLVAAEYTSWPGLFDRTYTGRHLPPASEESVNELPAEELVIKSLVMRQDFIPAPNTSALFAFFAQWFTDSFLRTHPFDRRLNTSNHEIDLCQIYGLKESTTDLLRSRENGVLGANLRNQVKETGEFGEWLFESDGSGGLRLKNDFAALPYASRLLSMLPEFAKRKDRQSHLYASGLERGNSTIFYSAISTVFRREHNRLCDELKRVHPGWDNDRIFQTARNINIALLLKIIVEDYVNHLSGAPVDLQVEIGFADKQKWYRTNRIAIEFDLLYRWHGLAPDSFLLDGEKLGHEGYRYNNALLEQHGVEKILDAASRQHAGKICLKNVPDFLGNAELSALKMSRQFRVAPYNEYREHFGMRRVGSFGELTGESKLAQELEKIYGDVDKVEFTVGLRAEQRPRQSALGELMKKMVGYDAFSQALTNPLLSRNVFGSDTFSEVGLKTIEETSRFEHVVKRNTGPNEGSRDAVASFGFVS